MHSLKRAKINELEAKTNNKVRRKSYKEYTIPKAGSLKRLKGEKKHKLIKLEIKTSRTE
jgi:hypothetical protein